jgi:D-alanine transaminase
VYEVIRIYGGKPFTLAEHLQRLERSAEGIKLDLPYSRTVLAVEIEKLVHKSQISEGMIYLQLTRGACSRNHLFPDCATVKPTLLFYVRTLPALPEAKDQPGVTLITMPDERWKRCWIKSIALLPNVLAKNEAISKGGDEALFIEDGLIHECSASNVHAIIDGKLISPPPGPKVLPGITRQVLIRCAREIGLDVVERAFSIDEARRAAELMITSTTREISWVKRWDDQTVATCVGPTTLRLHETFKLAVQQETRTGERASTAPKLAFGCR